MKKNVPERNPQILTHAIDIRDIPALTFSEQARSEYMRQQFALTGVSEVEMDDLGNVFACLKGGSQNPLILSAHLDSVLTPQLPVRQHENRLIGSGIGDNALGLAALLEMPHLLVSSGFKLPGDLWLVANVCEEGLGNLQGMKKLVERFGSKVSAYIALEGIGLGTIQQGALGIFRYCIEVITKGGHAWSHYGDPSAIHELIKIASKLTNLKLPQKPRTSLNIGIIEGGNNINSLASQAAMQVEIRSEELETLKALNGIVRKTIFAHQSDLVQVKMTQIGSRPSGNLPDDHPLLEKAVNALKVTGINAVLVNSSTDASLPISLGYPATCLGITSGGAAHSQEEFIDIDKIELGMKQLMNLIQMLWNS